MNQPAFKQCPSYFMPSSGDVIEYADAVRQMKELIVDFENQQWGWGEIAHRLEPKYGEATLARFADEVGMKFTKLKNCRTVYRAYYEDDQPAISFPVGVEQMNDSFTFRNSLSWTIGEIAHWLEPKYGEATLERFADEVEMSFTGLKKYRTVYEAYLDLPFNWGHEFGAAEALVKHPDRVKLLTNNPDMTGGEAWEKMEAYREKLAT